ncbi:MAG: hypothetical protein IKZ88_04215 [Neisseriaceae bacterium]|nr:hypothetical protein [Neisseriaceae bacterium]
MGRNAHPTTKPAAWRWVENPPYGVFGNGKNRVGNLLPTLRNGAKQHIFFNCSDFVADFGGFFKA